MSALATRDSNARPNPTASPASDGANAARDNEKHDTMSATHTVEGAENKPFGGSGMGYHGQMLGQKQKSMLKGGSNNGNGGTTSYVSPSDSIQSPASKKLADFKQRQMNKSAARKPAARTLFARTASTCSSGAEDAQSNETEEEKK